jgi:decaprenyl-phosphate phosphoribosyltransferase
MEVGRIPLEALDHATLPDGERRATRALVDVAPAVGERPVRDASTRTPAKVSPAIVLRACRPRQWSKNLLALAAACAAGWIDRPVIAAQALGAVVMLCMISSATYLVNDVRDREQDRHHPRKRERPVASGELSPRTALWIAATLAVTGISLATAITPGLGLLAICYLGLTASYSMWLRRVAVVDILVVAAGFVIRALAGGVATDIYLSRWFVIVTGCCAVFLVTAKRYAELRVHDGGDAARATLRTYSLRYLRFVLLAAATAAIAAYTSWAFTRPAHTLWYVLSIMPLVLWLVRYSLLIGRGGGQAPEELILHDRSLLALGVAWSALFLGGVYVGS